MSDPNTNTQAKPMDPADLAFVREYTAYTLDYGERHGWESPVWVPSRLVRSLDALLDSHTYQERRAEQAEANYRFMVERVADERLDGYRELGARAAKAENERDELRREVTRLRARVRVVAKDVERAGVTLAHVHAWERANGQQTSVVNKRVDERALARGRGHGLLAQFVRDNARKSKRPGLDILGEMAAMSVPT